ncbi:MAG: hypothetical protein JO317_03335 [Verrucomicrobiae bacterium]|nr:hypothetical protein [Verrucomicrobiae bacterium]
MTEPRYRRLARRALGFHPNRQSLWLGPDHVLLVNNHFYTEDYKRFYFRDIQAFASKRTASWLILAGLWALTALFFLWTASIADEPFEANASLVFAACAGGMLLYHLVAGPSCRTTLLTAVGAERISALDRVRKVRRVVARLRPLLEEAQGSLQPEAARIEWERRRAALPPRRVEPAGRVGTLHAVVIVTLLIKGCMTAGGIGRTNLAYFLTSTGVWLALGAATIAAMIQQQHHKPPAAVKNLTWIAFGYLVAHLLVGYFYFVFFQFQRPQIAGDFWGMFKAAAQLVPAQSAFLTTLHGLFAAIGIGLGIVGAALLLRAREAQANPSKVQAPTD